MISAFGSTFWYSDGRLLLRKIVQRIAVIRCPSLPSPERSWFLGCCETDKTILFEGDYLTPEDHPILLESGWNMFAYLRTETAPTIDVFSGIDDLVIVKDNLGMAYLPEFNFDGIGLMEAGKGYQAKVLSDQILEYLSNDAQYKMTNSEVKSELYHFTKPVNTGSNMSLVLPEYAWVNKPLP